MANNVALDPKLPLSIPVTVAPVANVKLVEEVNAPDTVAVPSTTNPSFTFIIVESLEEMLVPFICIALILTFPVPFGCILTLPLVLSVVI